MTDTKNNKDLEQPHANSDVVTAGAIILTLALLSHWSNGTKTQPHPVTANQNSSVTVPCKANPNAFAPQCK